MPHKEPSQNLSGHAAGWRSVSQKYNVIRSPDQYPCLVLGLLYLEQEKKSLGTSLFELQEFHQHS